MKLTPTHAYAEPAMSPPAESFRLLVDSVEDYAIFMLDPDGRVLTWNRGAERIKGYSAVDIVGRHFSAFYPVAEAGACQPGDYLRRAAAEGRIEVDGWRVRKDGSRFWANVVITALRDETGRLVGFGKVVRDLTEQLRAAEELNRSEERFRLLIEGVTDYAIYMLDPAGNVNTWNPGAQKIKGYVPSEIVGRHYSVFFTPEDVAAGRPQAELNTALQAGRYEEEGWRVRKDGQRFWANVVLTSLRDSTGQHIGFVKVTRDLTARKQAEEVARELLREQAARGAAEAAEARITEERERYKALSRRLEVILEGIADGITVQEPSGAIVFANSSAARLCGFDSVQELLSARLSDVVGRFDMLDEAGQPFDSDNLPARRVFRGEDGAAVALRVKEKASGRQWWTVIRASPVRDVNGVPEFAVNIWHEVTEDRRREEQARYISEATKTLASSLDYEQMLRALAGLLVPNLADWCSIHLLDGDTLHNVAVAHADAGRLEQARAYAEKYPPDPGSSRGIWQVLRTGESELHADISDDLLQLAAQDAEHLELLRRVGMKAVITVPIRARDRVSGTISLISAESGRRYDEADVALAEELGRRAGTAIENAKLYAAEKNARAQVELIARAGESLSGTFDYETTLRSVLHILLPAVGDFAFFDVVEGTEVRRVAEAFDDSEVDALIKQTKFVHPTRPDGYLSALSSGQSAVYPLIDDAWRRHLARDTEHLDLLRRLALCSLVTVPMLARGQLIGALTVCFGKSGRHHGPDDRRIVEDVARRAALAIAQARLFAEARAAAEAASRAARAAEEASRVKDEFLATVSHELRTPLNAIVGWSSLLRGRDTDQEMHKGLEVIHRNAQAQSKIIEDILDVSRIVTGKLRLELKSVDLTRIINDAIEVVRPSATAKQVRVELSLPEEPALLVADPERLQQVVWNLLSNALKFTASGGLVRVVVGRQESHLTLTVSDTGNGIDKDFLPHVFDRFKQADGSTTRRTGGLGLGLAIVRHIVELHGGSAHAESPGVGKGSTFSISLPVRSLIPSVRPASAIPEQLAHPIGAPGLPTLEGLRVLVVDDEPDARDLLCAVLAQAGAIVEVSASAAEAFALLQQVQPAVLISDIGMPGEDGFSLMRRIRALAPELGGGVPSIALTAYTRGDDKLKALSAGFTTHIGKPVALDELLAAVANLAKFAPRYRLS